MGRMPDCFTRIAFGLGLFALSTLPARAETPTSIVKQAPSSAWQEIQSQDLLVLTLHNNRVVVIQLAPAFAPRHVQNIVALSKARWWDGGDITRVQDGYVTQWAGNPSRKALPATVDAVLPPEYERPDTGLSLTPLNRPDAYAAQTGFTSGWPVGTDGHTVWLAHCYGMVGAGRDMPPNTGDGTELYTVIGQAPRQLDRNIALVGRVLSGMDALTALPRGTGDMGFYRTPAEFTSIQSARLAIDLPSSARPRFEVMKTDSPSFIQYLHARANRTDPFYVRPAGGVDVCNAPVPTRPSSQN